MKLFVLFSVGLAVLGLAQDLIPATNKEIPENCDANTVRCSVCRKPRDINSISGLPRLSFGLEPVPHDIGKIDWFLCTAENGSDYCEITSTEEQMGSFPADSSSPRAYLESIGVYMILGLFMGGVLPVLALLVCCCRWRRTCCCVENGTCGKDVPTPAERHPLHLGFRMLRPPDPKKKKRAKFHYPWEIRWGLRGCLVVQVLFVVVWIIVGHVRGNAAFTDAARVLVRAPQATQDLFLNMQDPMLDFVVRAGGNVLHPFLVDSNTTINNSSDIPLLVDSLDCMIYGIRNSLPNESSVIEWIQNGQTTAQNSLQVFSQVRTGIQRFRITELVELRFSVRRARIRLDEVLVFLVMGGYFVGWVLKRINILWGG